MENKGVCCSVNECTYHSGTDKCTLPKIEITHQKTNTNGLATPHYCKNYTQKSSR